MVRERYRAALIGLGRIADTIDDEVVGTGWFVPFSHMGSYMDVPECRWSGAQTSTPSSAHGSANAGGWTRRTSTRATKRCSNASAPTS